ncbi:uncharacterized protein LOC144501824 [Mustelus asterias]
MALTSIIMKCFERENDQTMEMEWKGLTEIIAVMKREARNLDLFVIAERVKGQELHVSRLTFRLGHPQNRAASPQGLHRGSSIGGNNVRHCFTALTAINQARLKVPA